MHNSREKQLRSCASAHHAPKHVDAPTIAPKSPARVLLRLRAVLLLPIYHRQTRACDGWQTHYYTLSVIQNAQRNRTPHEKQARIWRTAVRKPPIAPIEPSTWPALAIRYCRPIIRSLGYLVGGKAGIDRPGITCVANMCSYESAPYVYRIQTNHQLRVAIRVAGYECAIGA